MIDFQGAIHIHTHYSDGSGSLREIIKSAQEADLDYIIISDHNTLRAKKEGVEGWHGKTLVLVGEEVSGRAGHCLAFNIHQRISGRRKQPEQYLVEIKRNHGLSFIAHPYFGSNWMFAIRNVSWKNWKVPEFTGIEIWSYLADWAKDLTWFNFANRWLNPHHAISGPSPLTIKKWDELTQHRQVVAIGGVDAHAKVLTPFKKPVILPYYQVFETIRTHVLLPTAFTGTWTEDAKKIYRALNQGHAYLANDGIASSRGFMFQAFDENRKHLGYMGEIIKVQLPIFLQISIPEKSIAVRIIRNGETIFHSNESKFEHQIKIPGVYRIEVAYHRHSWIYSNPIYVYS